MPEEAPPRPAGLPVDVEALHQALNNTAAGIVPAVAFFDRDIEHRMHEQATLASVRYALEHMLSARPVREVRYKGGGRSELLEHALSRVTVDGFYAEFGVYQGASLGFIADRIDRVVYGFDSFTGLPERWSTKPKGAFDLQGCPPEGVGSTYLNYRIVQGSFRNSIPKFLEQVEGPAAFLHVDCFVHSSTRDVLDLLEARLRPGTVIVFGQYFNYPGWEVEQFKAFKDFCSRVGWTYVYDAFATRSQSVAVVLE